MEQTPTTSSTYNSTYIRTSFIVIQHDKQTLKVIIHYVINGDFSRETAHILENINSYSNLHVYVYGIHILERQICNKF